uniref:Calcitonin peptide-like domain-containing protein n=1 Tax=Monopterus albus TaxID=43700 RepID=A0A3Q3JJN9_MONAL|nr:calcitonin gene-related peptide 2 isoform X3 [Monopterus albus]XP_020449135.1 calcitonin gene-related peptide 2 isoform X3 [Monopterus albus]XP_020449136.1 calcitonin gene-related peptide 2 isoform X3 [Monopterus albus]XP_020449137.1 calcitonin gene-related peptide 2 isoform X3 [Monopterus albus]
MYRNQQSRAEMVEETSTTRGVDRQKRGEREEQDGQGTMVMLKISAFLVAYALVICQMYCSQAAPARPGLESMSDRVTLTDYEARRLLNAIVKEFVQMTAEELEQQETEGNSMDRPLTKRCSNLSTCVLGKLSQELHKLQTFPRTNVGAGTPGKKRSVPESDSYASYSETFDSI